MPKNDSPDICSIFFSERGHSKLFKKFIRLERRGFPYYVDVAAVLETMTFCQGVRAMSVQRQGQRSSSQSCCILYLYMYMYLYFVFCISTLYFARVCAMSIQHQGQHGSPHCVVLREIQFMSYHIQAFFGR